ncbi:hypothetical protein SAMN05216275_102398 [Streptosporangium canum]|uniref:Uncharacterized protein n=2 Tax=Streptosporangium canum TaxID=324952 RepID=A0A1I3H869_9ACTN|nr:hypothetical protein SAMN05216275_102398 [Streptosporangium canum]
MVISDMSAVVAHACGFLSDDQVRAYTAFEEPPSLPDLEKSFFLDALDLFALLAQSPGTANHPLCPA